MKLKNIILFQNTLYSLSDEQLERLKEVMEEANNLPFGGTLHIEEHLFFTKDQYILIGEMEMDFDNILE